MTNPLENAWSIAAIGQRFHLFFRSQGLTATEVAALLQVAVPTISKMVNGQRFSTDLLTSIQEHFPTLRLEWLLLNEGPMEDYQRQLTDDMSATVTELRQQYTQLAALGPAITDAQAKDRVAALSQLMDAALDMRLRLLSTQADVHNTLLSHLYHAE